MNPSDSRTRYLKRQRRYNASAKGRARWRRYRTSHLDEVQARDRAFSQARRDEAERLASNRRMKLAKLCNLAQSESATPAEREQAQRFASQLTVRMIGGRAR